MSCIKDLPKNELAAILLSQEPREICKSLKNFAHGDQKVLIEIFHDLQMP